MKLKMLTLATLLLGTRSMEQSRYSEVRQVGVPAKDRAQAKNVPGSGWIRITPKDIGQFGWATIKIDGEEKQYQIKAPEGFENKTYYYNAHTGECQEDAPTETYYVPKWSIPICNPCMINTCCGSWGPHRNTDSPMTWNLVLGIGAGAVTVCTLGAPVAVGAVVGTVVFLGGAVAADSSETGAIMGWLPIDCCNPETSCGAPFFTDEVMHARCGKLTHQGEYKPVEDLHMLAQQQKGKVDVTLDHLGHPLHSFSPGFSSVPMVTLPRGYASRSYSHGHNPATAARPIPMTTKPTTEAAETAGRWTCKSAGGGKYQERRESIGSTVTSSSTHTLHKAYTGV